MRPALSLAALSLCCATLSFAGEGDVAADFRGEETRATKSCSGFAFNALASCGELLFTDHPLHIAVGSLAPGNGFGSGVAVVGHWTTTNWRNTFDVDAVASSNFSWRAGGYATFVWAKVAPPKVQKGRPRPGSGSDINLMQEQPVIHAYAETDSLNKLSFFGIGPSPAGRTFFGMRETVTGASFVLPVSKFAPFLERLNISIVGEGNGRFVDTRGESGQGSPSIEQIYTPTTAPGLFISRGFAQFGEGVRLRPSFAKDHVQLDYLVNYQQYVAHDNYSFRRFTTDVSHTFQIYQNHFPPTHLDINGPDECFQSKTNSNATDAGAAKEPACPPALPPPGPTRNYAGSVQLRFLLSESIIPAGHVEPFYFQPTLGGSDINGNAMLGSFEDYRFRAPNLMMFRAAFEHSIYKWPVGLALMLDEGKVGIRRSDIDFSHLQHSYSVGLTLHAGGFPMFSAMFSWGGRDGTHITAAANTSLLGGGARPSLY